ncbi:MAG: sigma-54-dependent Fis family transcriptional regulator [Armatimonadota bacterium]
MRASDLKLNELVGFSKGQLMFLDRRLLVNDLRAVSQFIKDLLDMVGIEQARRILTRYGYFWGQADAQAMKRLFKWDSLEELLKAGIRLQSMQGIGKVVGTAPLMDNENGRYRFEVIWHNSGAAECFIDEIGITDHPVCWINIGYSSGYVSCCVDKPIYFIERDCKGKGDDHCIAIGADVDTWGTELEAYLPYFQSDDIQGKIERLTAELMQKNAELEGQRKQSSDRHRSYGGAGAPAGCSESYKRIIERVTQAAPLTSPVLITGEPGVGKHYIARMIHRLSPSASVPLKVVNCGVLSGTLLDSELFGHAAGAFPGADKEKEGLLEVNNGSTVFIDEIEHLSPATQLKILRVIESDEVVRLGENAPRQTNVRIIAASETDLAELVRQGKFRSELYYRLGTMEINIPPLRNRREDILPVARAILKDQCGKLNLHSKRLDVTCLDYLLDYDWPGNARELEYVITRAALLAKKGVITPEYLPEYILGTNSQPDLAKCQTLAQVEQEHIRSVMRSVRGNKTRAAEMLGIGLTTLWRKLKNT